MINIHSKILFNNVFFSQNISIFHKKTDIFLTILQFFIENNKNICYYFLQTKEGRIYEKKTRFYGHL